MFQKQGKPRRVRVTVLLWAMFGAGLLVQAFAPHLTIKNKAFVLPPSLISEGKDIHPADIVAHARAMQLFSGVLTLGGALGLALCYRKVLFETRSDLHDLVDRSRAASSGPRIVE
jgi:hypothetical protein